jgi:UDP-GlcNAc3NAcA epimerase
MLDRPFDIITIVGARPQFVKASVMSAAFLEAGIYEGIIHTGQHFDYEMNEVFFKELEIPPPIINLGIKQGSHSKQTGEMMIAIESFIAKLSQLPKALLLFGDTNSTLAGALVAAKLHIPIVHVEAGLRSFNLKMPEEINRIVTDRLSKLLFCSSNVGVINLRNEGIADWVFNVGDVMRDCFFQFTPFSKKPDLGFFDFEKPFSLLTLHRPSQEVDLEGVNIFLERLGQIGVSFIWPIHPRWKNLLGSLRIPEQINVVKPFSYLEMLYVLNKCEVVVTDSGGLQKEAYWAKKRCLTVREETEWVETVQSGWNKLIHKNELNLKSFFDQTPPIEHPELYGDGTACKQIAKKIKCFFDL